MAHKGGFPWRAHRCIYCKKLAVTYPHGKALCATHASEPNSEVYIVKLEQIKKKYLETYGVVRWDAFCLRTFQSNGKNYEDFTWKEIANASEVELDHPVECTCTPRNDCELCSSIARVIQDKEYE